MSIHATKRASLVLRSTKYFRKIPVAALALPAFGRLEANFPLAEEVACTGGEVHFPFALDIPAAALRLDPSLVLP